jgi:alcohol oxidase
LVSVSFLTAASSNLNWPAGDPEKLKKAGVQPIVNLPGVGLNFQDHYLTFSVFRAKPGTESFDDFARGDPEVQKRE